MTKRVIALLLTCIMVPGIISVDEAIYASSLAGEESSKPIESSAVLHTDTQPEEWIYGNIPENILNGGRMVEDTSGGVFITDIDEKELRYRSTDDQITVIQKDECKNLNFLNDHLYYTTSGEEETLLWKMAVSGRECEQIFRGPADMKQVYVINEEIIYYLSQGNIYSYSLISQNTSCLQADGSICSFIPTAYGMIYAKGTVLDYTIYAGSHQIEDSVYSYRLERDTLQVTVQGREYQVSLEEAFDEMDEPELIPVAEAMPLQVFSLAESDETDSCEECEANALLAARGIVRGDSSENLSTAPYTASTAPTVSDWQKAIVKRARQQAEIEWTPLKDITGWNAESTFLTGVEYRGLPYGQPAYASAKYVPWEASLAEFAAAVQDIESEMYTNQSTYNKVAPFYSSDCSAFAAWSWNLAERHTTSGLPGFGIQASSQSIYSAQVGDILNKRGNHTVLVSDIGYSEEGEILYIDILEQTPPKVTLTRYGWGGSQTLDDMQKKYIEDSYVLLHPYSKKITYTHDCTIPIDGDYCEECQSKAGIDLNLKTLWLVEGETAELQVLNNTLEKAITWTSSDPAVATVENGTVTAVTAGTVVVTAQVDEMTATCMVNVNKEPSEEPDVPVDPDLPQEPERIETVPMFRLYNPNSGEHFYTGSEEERNTLDALGWNYEGIAWNAPIIGEPIHRVYNPNSGDHHYTMSQEEVDMLVNLGWKYEGIAWNTASADNIPQYRMYNPNADLGSHHYTSSEEEMNMLIEAGWIFEGIGWYGMLQ